MPPEAADDGDTQHELQQLRDERALLVELLAVDRGALRGFMTAAARTLVRVRTQMRQRARDPLLYRRKVARLRAAYLRLLRRAAALPLPSLVQIFEETLRALPKPRDAYTAGGDALLPALVQIDIGFLALTTIATRAGMPFVARRGRRRRNGALAASTERAVITASNVPTPQMALALRQLAERLAEEHGKLVDLSAIGLEQVPAEMTGSIYDLLSQLLRNAIEHGIETPEQREALGKNRRGGIIVEAQRRAQGLLELIFQDDGQGLNAERIMQTALARGLIQSADPLARDPRQASTLIFHANLSTAADGEQRGAGMRIVRDHIKRLNGHVQVATKGGQFTRLRVRLPAVAGTDASAAQA